jgi:hypothetical protein
MTAPIQTMRIAKSQHERWILAVYHLLKIAEALVYLGSLSLLVADDWAAKWLFSFDDY